MRVTRTRSINDGGAWSLLGYLYQLLGAAATRVSLEGGDARDGDVEATIVEVEEHEQDVVIREANAVRLIQFKYSQRARDISPTEFAGVLTTFERSEASLDPKPASVRWTLQTNRPPSPKLKALLEGKRRPKEIPPAAARTIARLRGRVEIEQHTLADFEHQLHERARRFGSVDISRATMTVIGLVHEASRKPRGQRELTLQDLDNALAGYLDARSIRAADCAARLQQQLVEIARDQSRIALADALPRRAIEDLLGNDDIALAVVTGPGGSGKTLSLLKGLHDFVGRQPKLVGVLMPPPNASRTLPQLVTSWRNARGMAFESLDDVLHCILIANEKTPRPVLLLGLDGLDESRWRERDDVQSLLLHFLKLHQRALPPDALLIVTCRTSEEFFDLLALPGEGGQRPHDIPEVRLNEFTIDEFRSVWERWFSREPIPPVGGTSDTYATLNEAARETLPSDVARALLHPVLLGGLRDWSSDARARLMAGDRNQWQELLMQYVRWFSRKVARRRDCEAGTVRIILRAAAVATANAPNTTTFDMEQHWIDPGIRDSGEVRALVKAVFEDAVTAGVLDSGKRFEMPTRAPVTWKWHFAFVPEHLRTLP